MNKKWITIIGSGVLCTGLAVVGLSFADSDDSAVRGGTIRLEKQVEADFPVLAKRTIDQANGFLVYGVEVVTADNSIVDVKVDAGSGKILAMDKDKADDEDHEISEHGRDQDHED
jgi:hypothetical protein